MAFEASPPYVVAEIDFEVIYAQRIAAFLVRWEQLRAARPELALPSYDAASLQSHPAAVALQHAADGDFFYRGVLNDVARATLLVGFAVGADLDLHGLATITPAFPSGMTRHADESDDSFRARILSARAGASAAGPDEWWISHIRAAHPDAVGASFIYRGLGLLTVSIRVAEGGDAEAVLSAVTARLAEPWVRPQGVTVDVVIDD